MGDPESCFSGQSFNSETCKSDSLDTGLGTRENTPLPVEWNTDSGSVESYLMSQDKTDWSMDRTLQKPQGIQHFPYSGILTEYSNSMDHAIDMEVRRLEDPFGRRRNPRYWSSVPTLDNKEFLITSIQTREEGAPVTWNPATQTREERDSVSWNPDTQTIENIAPCQGSEELTVSVKQNGWCQQVISWCRRNVIILLGFIGALILIVFVLSVCLTTRHPVLPLGPPCHIDWIWAKGKCYYFSDTQGDWESSRKFCISQNATLVMLKDKNVKVSLFVCLVVLYQTPWGENNLKTEVIYSDSL
ncbi:hypothetical protein FKM82_010062 [Ascaphus truei]